MEKNPQCPKHNLETELRAKGYTIEKLPHDRVQPSCDDNDCFEQSTYVIEGSFCCDAHKEKVLAAVKKSDDLAEQKKQEEQKFKNRT